MNGKLCRGYRLAGRGFTLIEMMVVIAIIGILTVWAFPSFDIMIRNNRLAAETNGLIGDLTYVRGNVPAGKRGAICPSNDGATCATGTAWTSGRIMFIDANRNGTMDTGDTLLRVSNIKGGGGFRIIASAAGAICFESNGDGTSSFSNAAGCVKPVLTMCDSRSGNYGRTVSVPGFGPAQVTRDAVCP